jgi:putative hydrolase
MKYLIDTHTHTIASGHAYSTLLENVKYASEKGLKMMAVTDHGVGLNGGPHIYHFGNLKVIPRELWGVEILRGVEANIMDYDGNLDMPEDRLLKLDLVIASLHEICIEPGSEEENTRALLKAMDNKYVDIIGHSGNPVYPIDIDAVVKKAKEKNILIEINNSSFSTSRIGSYDNCLEIARKAKEIGATLVLGSDAHICFDIGNFKKAEELIKELDIPDDMIINTSVERFKQYLFNKGKILDLKVSTPLV